MLKSTTLIAAASFAALSAMPAQATPPSPGKAGHLESFTGTLAQPAAWNARRQWHGRHWGHRRHRGLGWGIAGGIAAGALLADSLRYNRISDDAMAACESRYRSFDPATGTYLSYDGNRYLCPYL